MSTFLPMDLRLLCSLSRRVALGSCSVVEYGRKAGVSSSSSASSDRPILDSLKRGGRRRIRDFAGSSESEDDSDELDTSGDGERCVENGTLGGGDIGRRYSVAFVSLGLV